MLWLLLFLGFATAVVARQTAALQTARRVRELREARAALEARRDELVRRIRLASGREVLVPKAVKALGLHLPSDSEFVLFPDPSARTPDDAP